MAVRFRFRQRKGGLRCRVQPYTIDAGSVMAKKVRVSALHKEGWKLRSRSFGEGYIECGEEIDGGCLSAEVRWVAFQLRIGGEFGGD